MPGMRLPIYTSSNGDRWLLCRGERLADVFIMHEANAPSGGAVSRIEIGPFLLEAPRGPQHEELLNLLGQLIDRDHAVPPSGGASPEAGAAAAEPTPGEEGV